MELSCSSIKKFLIFSQKKVFLIYTSGNGNLKKILYFRKQNFLIFQETKTLKSPKLENLLIFPNFQIPKKQYFLQKKVTNKFFKKHSRIIVFIFSIN